MAGEVGMDVDVVRSIAAKLDGQAQVLAGVVAAVEGVVGHLPSIWVGADAQQFEGWWHNQHKPALQQAEGSISGLAQSARNNASDQDAASGAAAAGVGIATALGLGAVKGAPAAVTPPATAPLAAGPNGPQSYSAARSIQIAQAEVAAKTPLATTVNGSSFNAPGQCVVSVQRWINDAGGHFAGGGGPLDAYANSHAVQLSSLSDVRAGDVLQRVSTSAPDSWSGDVHTVLVTGVNPNGTLQIAQTNVSHPPGDPSVTYATDDTSFTATSAANMPPGTEWLAYRFASQP